MDDPKRKGKEKVVYEVGESSSSSQSHPNVDLDLNLAPSETEPEPKRPKLAPDETEPSSSQSPPPSPRHALLGPRIPLSSIPPAKQRRLFNPASRKPPRPKKKPSSLALLPFPDAPAAAHASKGPKNVEDYLMHGQEARQRAKFSSLARRRKVQNAKMSKTGRGQDPGRVMAIGSLHGTSPLKPGPPPFEIVKKAVMDMKAYINQLAYAKAYFGNYVPPLRSDPVGFNAMMNLVLPFAPPEIAHATSVFPPPVMAQATSFSASETVHEKSSSASPFSPPIAIQATSFLAPETVHETSSSASPFAPLITAEATSFSAASSSALPITAQATTSFSVSETVHATSSTSAAMSSSSMEVEPGDEQAASSSSASTFLDQLEIGVLPSLETVIEKLDEYIDTIPRTVSPQEMLQEFQAKVDVEPMPSWYSLMKKSRDAFWNNLIEYFTCEAVEDDDADEEDEESDDHPSGSGHGASHSAPDHDFPPPASSSDQQPS